jgi:hypothetical protein
MIKEFEIEFMRKHQASFAVVTVFARNEEEASVLALNHPTGREYFNRHPGETPLLRRTERRVVAQ